MGEPTFAQNSAARQAAQLRVLYYDPSKDFARLTASLLDNKVKPTVSGAQWPTEVIALLKEVQAFDVAVLSPKESLAETETIIFLLRQANPKIHIIILSDNPDEIIKHEPFEVLPFRASKNDAVAAAIRRASDDILSQQPIADEIAKTETDIRQAKIVVIVSNPFLGSTNLTGNSSEVACALTREGFKNVEIATFRNDAELVARGADLLIASSKVVHVPPGSGTGKEFASGIDLFKAARESNKHLLGILVISEGDKPLADGDPAKKMFEHIFTAIPSEPGLCAAVTESLEFAAQMKAL
ncbi:Uncharacterised protein [Candidatus Gugararchaeum adminiculabundum]|nr:Uncharacterised protein [Candidatus Gugararchaeum adminiculabundum]